MVFIVWEILEWTEGCFSTKTVAAALDWITHLHYGVNVTLSMLDSKSPVRLMNVKKSLLCLFKYMQFYDVPLFLIQGKPKAMRDLTQFMNSTSFLGWNPPHFMAE